MSCRNVNSVLPPDYDLDKEYSELEGRDGKTYLQFASQMTTFYKQTYGEHSRFMLALREGRLIGAKCPKCGNIAVPANTWHCPNCNFTEMEEVELPHRGVLAQTAPITIFPNSTFIGDAPFCRGYVDVAVDSPIAGFLPSRLRTTTGLVRPGIFVMGTELKLVFEDERVGRTRDIFWVPMAEVPAHLRAKQPLLASELDFASPKIPAVEITEAGKAAYAEALGALERFAADTGRSPRARKDLTGRVHLVEVKTGGGDFFFRIADGRVWVGGEGEADFTMVAEDPGVFTRWVNDGSLTDAAVEGALWLPHKEAFQLMPILDRLPRSVRRDGQEGKL
ncbi:MAG: zinc ribbon domain-containing protein [Pseudomonadota bacterium]